MNLRKTPSQSLQVQQMLKLLDQHTVPCEKMSLIEDSFDLFSGCEYVLCQHVKEASLSNKTQGRVLGLKLMGRICDEVPMAMYSFGLCVMANARYLHSPPLYSKGLAYASKFLMDGYRPQQEMIQVIDEAARGRPQIAKVALREVRKLLKHDAIYIEAFKERVLHGMTSPSIEVRGCSNKSALIVIEKSPEDADPFLNCIEIDTERGFGHLSEMDKHIAEKGLSDVARAISAHRPDLRRRADLVVQRVG